MIRVLKICVTGAPGSDKWQAIRYICENYRKPNTMIVPLDNTFLSSDITHLAKYDHDIVLWHYQIDNERDAIKQAITKAYDDTFPSDLNIIIISHLGLPDILSHVDEADLDKFLIEVNTTLDEATTAYDAYINLITYAISDPAAYDDDECDFENARTIEIERVNNAWTPYGITSKTVSGKKATRNADALLAFKQLVDQLL